MINAAHIKVIAGRLKETAAPFGANSKEMKAFNTLLADKFDKAYSKNLGTFLLKAFPKGTSISFYFPNGLYEIKDYSDNLPRRGHSLIYRDRHEGNVYCAHEGNKVYVYKESEFEDERPRRLAGPGSARAPGGYDDDDTPSRKSPRQNDEARSKSGYEIIGLITVTS